jgi:cation diffusion facilitator family transporter
VTAAGHHELPPDKKRLMDQANRLELVTIVYLVSAIVAIYLTLGASQAMKTAWFEDIISLVPPVVFLIASRIRQRAPNTEYPYGYHRSVSVAYLCAALALLAMGAFLLFDSVMKLISFEHPSIGTVQLFGQPIWLGWLMLPALVWSAIPAVLLGRAKLPLASALHDKVLFADAKMNKADWMTASAAFVGVLGIAVGLWWADAVAALVISLDIVHDGITNTKTAVADLMDSRPMTVDRSSADPLPRRVENELRDLDWVEDVRVRMREEGHVFFGEAFVVPRSDRELGRHVSEALEHLRELDWRLHDVVITPVARLDPEAAEPVEPKP